VNLSNFLKKNLLFIFIVFASRFSAQQIDVCFSWAKQLGGTAIDGAYCSGFDATGNVYTTGYFKQTADFDPGSGTYTMTSSSIWSDIYISKLNSSGQFVWAKQIECLGGSGHGRSLKTDASGNLYVSGLFSGTCDFDPGPGTYTLSTFNSMGFLLKLDPAGNFLWVQQLGGEPYSLALDISGNIILAGVFNSTSDFDPGPGTYTMTSAGFADFFVCKFNPSGNFQWAVGMGSINPDEAHSVQCDASGNIYVTGFYNNGTDFDPGPGVLTLPTNGSSDTFILKLDAAGNLVWAKNIGGANSDGAFALCLDGSNNIIIAGAFKGICDFDPGPGTYTLSAIGSNTISDCYVLKLDASGSFLWAKVFGSSANIDEVRSLSIDNTGNIYAGGYFYGTVDFDPGPGNFILSAIASNADAFLSKFDPSGNYFWTKTFGGINGESILSLEIDASLNILACAPFTSFIDFDPTPGTYTIASYGASDAYILKLGQALAPYITASGTTTFCAGGSVILAANNGSNYLWNIGSTASAITATTSGNYVVSATNIGCTVYSPSISVVVNPAPLIVVPGGSICSGSSFTLTPFGAVTYTFSGGSATVSPATSSTYSVIGTNSLGCTSINPVVVTVTVIATPTISVNSGSICSGSIYSINPSGAVSYSFSGVSPTVSPTISTNYTITGESQGCNALPVVITVSVKPSPSLTISPTPSLLCVGSTATLNLLGTVTSFTWSNGSSLNPLLVSPTITTSYYAVAFLNECSDTIAYMLNVSVCTNAKREVEDMNSELIVYPNPTTGYFSFDTRTPVFITLFDHTGRVVYFETDYAGGPISLLNHKAGVYFLVIESKEKTRKTKVITLNK
jgi:hypothetical protein